MAMPIKFTVRVRFTAGTHVTSTINRQRASSTSSAEQAVKSLAHKLVPNRVATVRQTAVNTAGGWETWEIYA